MLFCKTQAVSPDSNPVAAKGKTGTSVKDFMQLPETAAVTGPEPYGKQGKDDQKNQQGQTPFCREKTKEAKQEQDGQSDDTELDIHGNDQIDADDQADQADDRNGKLFPFFFCIQPERQL